ncbi:RNA polymerase sigma-70 factor, ECF subfamily [Mariprofundus ferrinatatus]|uniref:RNA polymerase sigma-70 factor, ECF subfamily n=1 Tax=Mariprofundus ferrinatatus TaxID=1921087 RepID=A0A2K8LBN4_9PROT|nr:sigma-70 family RNA polymerase sigma factor [Mariprofundus ferrinatatus]ATX81656.1 RNA polymerase sigma-70 factor, ECF subfamily [Mariprofundus ferrinatatus]
MNPDPHAWVTEHGDYLYRYAISRLQNEDVAADLVQDTLLAAWKGHASFTGQSTVRTWLTGILKHKIIDYIRKEVRDRNLNQRVENDPTSSWFNDNGSWSQAPGAWSENPEALCQNGQFTAVLDLCVSKLPEHQALIFRLRDISGDDTETICKSCNISATNLHVILHRARLALRKCLELNWFGERFSK